MLLNIPVSPASESINSSVKLKLFYRKTYNKQNWNKRFVTFQHPTQHPAARDENAIFGVSNHERLLSSYKLSDIF
jgi:hypothetical protein